MNPKAETLYVDSFLYIEYGLKYNILVKENKMIIYKSYMWTVL